MMKAMLMKKQKGQGIVEYAGALVLAAVIVTAAIAFVNGGFVGDLFTAVEGRINTAFGI